MQAGIARTGRILLAVSAALMMVLSMMFVLADRADASSVDPVLIEGNENCAAATGLQELTRFEPVESGTQDGVTITVSGSSFNWSSTVTIAAVFVKGGPDGNLYDYRPGGATADTDLVAPDNASGGPAGLSHITFCIPDTTTTTTQPTTTTTLGTTTTTLGTTTTTQATTTSTLPPEVGASIVVTVEGACVETDGEGEGVIDVTVSVDNGATVVVRDSDDDVVGTFTSDGSVTVPEGETYTWEATPNEGFEFPVGSETSGSIVIETCSNPETLPFTGLNTGMLALIATGLAASGAAMLFASKRREEM